MVLPSASSLQWSIDSREPEIQSGCAMTKKILATMLLEAAAAVQNTTSNARPRARCSDLALMVDLTARIPDAVADRLLVNIQPDVRHMSLRSLRGSSLKQRSR